MKEYTATLAGDDRYTNYIVVQPPFNPSEGFLSFCSDQHDTNINHDVTTTNTTLLQIEHQHANNIPEDEMLSRFQQTAEFIASTLNAIDAGDVSSAYVVSE